MREGELFSAGLLFAATALVVVRFRIGEASSNQSKEDEEETNGGVSTISRRGRACKSPPLSYIVDFFQCLQNPCHPVSNPEGHIGLCVAENKLAIDLLAERLMQPGSVSTAFGDPDVYGYNSFLGLPVVREALAYFFTRRFLRPDGDDGDIVEPTPPSASSSSSSSSDPDPSDALAQSEQRLVNPRHVAIGSGAAPILSNLAFTLCEAGDVCLVPAPYYAAFDYDLRTIAGCKTFPVHMANPSIGPTPADLEFAFRKARRQGLRIKLLLITNPNNPLGVIYSASVLKSIVQWARSRQVHTISDEIYALSAHRTTSSSGRGFQSIIRVLDNQLGKDVHLVWALSKDFGASGFRVGALYTQNEELIESLTNVTIFSGVSHPIQMITAEILTDDEFVDHFLEGVRERLRYSYKLCTAKLDEMVIPYVPAEAGMFVYADFSSLLVEKTWDGEERLAQLMFKFARIVLTPGHSQIDSRPGMFRICYAWVIPEILEIAMERLSRLVVKLRKMDWDDLNETTLQSIIN